MIMTFIQKITVVMLLLNFIVVGVFAYLLFWPTQLPIIYNEPFPVSPKEIKKGEVLTITMEVNKRKQYTVDVHKNIVCNDGNLVTLAPNKTSIPLGTNTIEVEIIIPTKASFSTCHVEFENEYKINALRIEHQKMVTQSFKIIP